MPNKLFGITKKYIQGKYTNCKDYLTGLEQNLLSLEISSTALHYIETHILNLKGDR